MGQKKMPKNAKKSQNMFFLRSTVRKLLSEVIKKCYYKYSEDSIISTVR